MESVEGKKGYETRGVGGGVTGFEKNERGRGGTETRGGGEG